MIVDCHTHIKPIAEDNGVSEHLAAAETVDVCIVLANSDGPSNQVNKRLSQYVNKHKEKMIGFAVVEPGNDKISTNHLKSIPDKLDLKGTVLYCAACGFHPTHSRAMRFYESAQELDLPVFFHNSGNPLGGDAVLEYAQPFLLDEVAREFANLKIIIGSMGVPFVEQTLAMVGRHKNVYADLTIHPNRVWQTYNMVVAAHENGVMDKLIFGSGFPTSTSGQCIETLLGFNMLLADTNLPTVPRVSIRNIIERDTLELLGIKDKSIEEQKEEDEKTKGRESRKNRKDKRDKDNDD
jgi:predicted TIM-barrel fold metal-dependent hydrolase